MQPVIDYYDKLAPAYDQDRFGNIEVAAAKYLDRVLHQADLTQLTMKVTGRTFQAGLCFHVLMHLPESEVRAFLQQAALLVEKGGVLIVDIPSVARRRIGRRPSSGWHGDTAATLAQFSEWAGPNWQVSRWIGLLLFPIHRFPRWARPWLQSLDRALCRTPLGRLASYYVLELRH